MLNPNINTGLIIEEKPSDFLGGSLPHEARNTTRNWRKFRSRAERQKYAKVDAMNCVLQTSTNLWEAQANWMLVNNLWPADAMAFWNKHGYIVDGKFEISERFNSKIAKVTSNGTSYQRGLDSIRNDGVVPEWRWPAQDAPDIDKFYWNDYYKPIPQDIIDLGKESTKFFTFPYERIDVGSQKNVLEVIKKALEHAPIGVAVTTCSPWGANPPVCEGYANHAVTNDVVENNQYILWDSYDPCEKLLAKGYIIHYAVKAVLYPVKRIVINPQVLTKNIRFGDMGEEVGKLKRALNKLGWLPDINKMPDFYGSSLANVVFRFQLANVSHVFLEMLLNLKGRLVGPRTRAAINSVINKI